MPDNPTIYQTAIDYRNSLLSRERASAIRLVQAYGKIWNRLKKQLDRLTNDITEARRRGEAVNYSWLMRQERYAALLLQATREMGRFADLAEREISKEQQAAIKASRRDSQSLMQAATRQAGIEASFNVLSAPSVEAIAGFLGNGSPLKSLLDQLPQQATRKIQDELIEAVAVGRNPRATARRIRQSLGGNLARALMIARTETLRAYRETSHQTYRANADVVEGWYWVAAKGPRTCAACLALDGTFHATTERMRPHPNCRCVQVPGVQGVDLGIVKGEDWFAEQPAKTQRSILKSEAAYQAYKSGELRLRDFVGRRESIEWGASYYQLSAKRALNRDARFPQDAFPRK